MTPLLQPNGDYVIDILKRKPLCVCWSLVIAGEPRPMLEMSAETKAVVQAEEILWFQMKKDIERYRNAGLRVSA